MKATQVLLSGMLVVNVVMNPMLALAKTEPLHDFEKHCDETIKIEKIIKMENTKNVQTVTEEAVVEQKTIVGEVALPQTELEKEVVVIDTEEAEEVVVQEVEEEEEIVVTEVEEVEVEENTTTPVEEEYYHDHETDATCYKCDLPLIHCGCELPNPTIVTCEKCGLDELHCVCEVTEFPTCELCGEEFVNCHCEFIE